MLDHIGFPVSDLERSKLFYQEALRPMGMTLLLEVTAEQTGGGAHAGFGAGGKPFFWIGDGTAPNGSVHVAFAAENRNAVQAFYEAALKAGGVDSGSGPPATLPR